MMAFLRRLLSWLLPAAREAPRSRELEDAQEEADLTLGLRIEEITCDRYDSARQRRGISDEELATLSRQDDHRG
jgi:hypothetical protein